MFNMTYFFVLSGSHQSSWSRIQTNHNKRKEKSESDIKETATKTDNYCIFQLFFKLALDYRECDFRVVLKFHDKKIK